MFTKRPEAATNDKLPTPEQLNPPTLDLRAIEQQPPKAAQPYKKPSQPTSVIGPELTVAGSVTSNGTVHIDGRIEGDVHCATLTVGETATISGGVRADQIAVNGEVQGNINGDHVTLEPKARVSGDIHHRSLAIAQGAHFEGWARRNSEKDGMDRKSIEASLRASESYDPLVLDATTLNELPNPSSAVADQADDEDDEEIKKAETSGTSIARSNDKKKPKTQKSEAMEKPEAVH